MQWNKLFLVLLIASILVIVVLWCIVPETKFRSTTSAAISFQEFYLPFYHLLQSKNFVVNAFIISTSYSIAIAWITSSPFFLIEQYHFSSMQYGNLQISVFGGYLLGTQILRILLFKYSKESIVTIGVTLLFTSSVVLLISNLLLEASWQIIVLCISINSLASGIFSGPINRIIITNSVEQVGVTIATLDLVMLAFGNIIGTITSFFVQNNKLFAITIFILGLFAFINNILREKIGTTAPTI